MKRDVPDGMSLFTRANYRNWDRVADKNEEE